MHGKGIGMDAIDRVALFIAQAAYLGKVPGAPGTAGTLGGVLLYLGMRGTPPLWYGAACVAMAVLGVWAAGRAEALLGRKDDQSIVIDEVAGYLVSMAFVPAGWGYAAAGFVLFRIFDIAKPGPLKRLQEVRGGFGVMLDDLAAALCANAVLQVASRLIMT